MTKPMAIVVCAVAAASLSVAALARGAGGGGGASVSGSAGFSHGSAGGPSASGGASANSNGRFAEDRDKGLDRAEDRMSAQGAAHEKAPDGAKHKKRRPAKPSKPKDD
jgi:hypothetical protein